MQQQNAIDHLLNDITWASSSLARGSFQVCSHIHTYMYVHTRTHSITRSHCERANCSLLVLCLIKLSAHLYYRERERERENYPRLTQAQYICTSIRLCPLLTRGDLTRAREHCCCCCCCLLRLIRNYCTRRAIIQSGLKCASLASFRPSGHPT